MALPPPVYSVAGYYHRIDSTCSGLSSVNGLNPSITVISLYLGMDGHARVSTSLPTWGVSEPDKKFLQRAVCAGREACAPGAEAARCPTSMIAGVIMSFIRPRQPAHTNRIARSARGSGCTLSCATMRTHVRYE